MPTYIETMNYVACCTICALVCGLLGFKIGQSMVAMYEVKVFRILSLFAVVTTSMDGFWKICSYIPALGKNVFLIWIVNLLYFIGTTIVTYMWYNFIRETTIRRSSYKDYPFRKLFGAIPCIIGVFLHILSPLLHLSFYIAPDGTYVRGKLFSVHTIICVGYLCYAFILTLIRAIKSENSVGKKENITLCIWSSIPVMGAVFQVTLAYAPFNEIAMTIAMIYLFVNMQEARITTDALTGLTNRHQMHLVLDRKLKNAENDPFVLFIADINEFKSINDNYGHLEGDKALMGLADTFRSLGSKYSSLFVCRYGGDEFLFTLSKSSITNEKEIIDELNNEFRDVCRKNNFDFVLGISVGYSIVDNNKFNINHLIEEADAMMYENKKSLSTI